MSTPGTTLSEWARVVALSLRRAGVQRVLASPGSRSTPYLAALLTAELDVVDVVDERAAAFAALGVARASGEPAAVLCTSGTAPAHWLPAVIEASLARVPLVLLSADRPTELAQCGAPQTVDQVKLFGAHVRFFADTGNPEPEERALAGLRRVVAQAVALARGPDPGPVHLNLRARKPLEPRTPVNEAEHALRRVADAVLERPMPSSRALVVPPTEELEAAAARLCASERPLFVAGPLAASVDAEALVELAARSGGALFAELTSQLRFARGRGPRFDTFDGWVGAGLFSDRGDPVAPPDVVVQLGTTPTSGVLERWLGARAPARVVLGVPDWNDPHASAELVVRGDPSAIARALLARLGDEPRGDPAWLEGLARLEDAGETILDALAARWGEPAIARTLVASLPQDARLVVGNSLPIRMLDRHGLRGLRDGALSVLHQRGANGIDGLVAQSFGATLADARPTAALLGDLTLLHDVGALSAARRARAPLVLVVVANGGGRIFEMLPVAHEAAWMMPHVVTEEPIDHEALARAFGLRHRRVETSRGLAEALGEGLARPGTTLVEAVVPAHGAAELGLELRARFERALAARRSPR
ncbi:MAG: 2-succinyl-5-enolpyruvyl-6-hydroxy-3-cyclohexene-1-carboxylic-acid synthase [Sandaracinaceae bacterium]